MRRQSKTSGWAAFDLQQKQKDHIGAQPKNDPYPSLPSIVTSLQPSETFSRNNSPYARHFSSGAVHCVDFPSTLDYKKSGPSKVGSLVGLHGSEISKGNKCDWALRQLKEHYNWADDGLIKDVMVAVNNDFDKASLFLKGMIYDDRLEMNKDNVVFESSSNFEKLISNDRTFPGKSDYSSENIFEPTKAFFVPDSPMGKNNGDMKGEIVLHAENHSDGFMDINSMIGQSTYLLIEPEWEEDDDLYSSYRKDAIKMMRSAAHHSKLATSSYVRRDHFAAQQFSLKAKEEWAAAKRLNEEAAREILSIQNKNNGLWRLDLHGLHAAEAVQALDERLRIIEGQLLSKRSNPSSMALHPSSGGHDNWERSDEHTFCGQKPKFLEVITGIGKHSRGTAALPTAVKTFLSDNGYRFDEARPGVIMVRPKFRLV